MSLDRTQTGLLVQSLQVVDSRPLGGLQCSVWPPQPDIWTCGVHAVSSLWLMAFEKFQRRRTLVVRTEQAGRWDPTLLQGGTAQRTESVI